MIDLKEFKGFTLAEVLITLVIIGVIAAMTIPTLINKTEKQELVSKFKKNYTVFANAVKMAQAQNGLLTGWDWSSVDSGYDNIENYILPHLQIADNCKNTGNCNLPYTWTKLNGGSWVSGNLGDVTDHYVVVLNDGAVVAMYIWPSCIENNKRCMDIHVDVNGPKGPNRKGRDVFSFDVYPFTNDVYPRGFRTNTYDNASAQWTELSKSSIENDCNKSSNGWYCEAKIILDGYKMNY